jgi:hypothetical protein
MSPPSPRAPQSGPVGLAPLGRRLSPEELAAANAHRGAPLAPEEGAAAPEPIEADAVPVFATREEAEAWHDTHRPSQAADARWRATPGNVDAARSRLAASRGTAPPKQPAPISLRLEADTVRRLRALAAKKGTKYQTLLKQFVVERLYEEEQREGLVARGRTPAP